MELGRALLYIFLSVIISLILKSCKRPFNYPPGPKGWPFIGYIFKAIVKTSNGEIAYFYQQISNLSEIYGPVIGFFLGPLSLPVIFVCGPEAVKEALTNCDLDGRLNTSLIRGRTAGYGLGYLYGSGKIMKEQRQFTIKNLRNLGFGKSSSEPIIQEEILKLLKIMMPDVGHCDKIVNFKHIFRQHNLNIIWAFVTGKSFDDDGALQLSDSAKYKKKLELRPLNVFTSNLLPIPEQILRILPVKVIKQLGLHSEGYQPLSRLLLTAIESRMSSNNINGDNFIDIYIEEIERQKNREGNSSFTKNQLVANLVDLFEASSHTTENAIGWFLLYMIHYPDVQFKIQLELDEVCGDDLPSLKNQSRLNYTAACLMEVQRLHNVGPFTLPHLALKETTLQGYSIPKNSMVIMSLYSVHTDSRYWPDPKIFRPERHLSTDGKLKRETNHFMPFGIGGRSCLGETIARQMYFLFCTSILKTFNIKANPENPLPTLSPYYAGGFLFYNFFNATISLRKTMKQTK